MDNSSASETGYQRNSEERINMPSDYREEIDHRDAREILNLDSARRAARNKFFIEIVYFCLTTFVIVTITLAAVINISRNNHSDIFISLLSTCIGVILPQPAIRAKASSRPGTA